jgi:hypothetical protein
MTEQAEQIEQTDNQAGRQKTNEQEGRLTNIHQAGSHTDDQTDMQANDRTGRQVEQRSYQNRKAD